MHYARFAVASVPASVPTVTKPSHRSAAPPPPVPDAGLVVAELMAVSRVLVAISARALAELDDTLTLPQLRALVVLSERQPLKLAALAAALAVNPSTALRMVERLETAGLVDRRANPGSRREVALRLTPAGLSLATAVMTRRRQEMSALVARIPAAQRPGLVAMLRTLTEAAGTVDPVTAEHPGLLLDTP